MLDNPDNAHTKDSTNNSNNGTKAAANQPLETVSRIGKGQTFNGTSSTYVQSGNASSLNPTNALTIETLAKRSGNGTYAWPHLVTKNGQYLLHAFNSSNASQSNLFIGGQWRYINYANGFPVGEWKNITVTYDGAAAKMWDAGTVVASQNVSGNLGTSSNIFTISNTFNGTIDEVRISNIARSADWLKATYLSHNESLINYGAAESLGLSTFVYDGDGNRVMKTEGGQTVLYVNKFYEKNLTTGNVTTYYYSGSKMIAEREATTLRYFHQDSLSSTSLMTDASGNSLGTTKFYPFGQTRSGSVPTDIKFTGQRLDDTELYYYGARYYDPSIGRFISPDSIVPDTANPQAFNRYSYVLNNPLKYIDPTGHYLKWSDESYMYEWIEGEDPDANNGNSNAAPPPMATTPPSATITPPPAPEPAPTPGTPTPTPPPPAPAPAPAQPTAPLPLAPAQPVATVEPEPEPPGVVQANGAALAVVSGSSIISSIIGGVFGAAGVTLSAPVVVTVVLAVGIGIGIGIAISNASRSAHQDSEQVDDILAGEKAGDVKGRFPGEWRGKTYGEVKEAAKKGDASARTAKKILDRGKYNK